MKEVYRNLTLGDIFLLPIPDEDNCHYFVILANLQEENKCLLVNFSSIKEGLYYDNSCIFDEKDDIRFRDGNLLITQKSCVRYDKAIEINNSYLVRIKNTYRYCGHLNFSLFTRLIEGAKKTHELEDNLKFMYNLSDNRPSSEKKVIILKRKLNLQLQR